MTICVACGDTGKNSRGGPCFPCQFHKRIPEEPMANPIPTKKPEYSLFDINIYELDLEVLEQAEKMRAACKRLAELEGDEDEAEAFAELRTAKLKNMVRSDPTKHGLDPKNPTETAIKDVIIVMEDYQKAQKRYRDAKYAAAEQKAVVRALDQRKTMLELIVKLHGQGYFAVPRMTDENSHKAKEFLEMQRRKMERQQRLEKKAAS